MRRDATGWQCEKGNTREKFGWVGARELKEA